MREPNRAIAAWAASWTVLALAECVVRLGHRTAQLIAHGLDVRSWCALVAFTGVMTYIEGYRALHRRFVPMVIERSFMAAREARGLVDVALAPLFALSLVGAPATVRLRAWASVAAIIVAAHAVRRLPSPWREITDGAVATALAFGLVSLVVSLAARWRTRPYDLAQSARGERNPI